MKQDLPFAHLGILILLFLISVNLLILDFKIFYPLSFLASEIDSKSPPAAVTPQNVPYYSLSCPAGCLDIINQATADSRFGTPVSPAPLVQNVAPAQKEYIIPLGNGQTTKSDWENLISTETVINPQDYGNIKEAYLIASLKNPTRNGQVEARLYNVTDNYPIFGSHVVMNGPSEQTITSQGFALPTASKLYRIQLKSSLSFSVSLENCRLKIIVR